MGQNDLLSQVASGSVVPFYWLRDFYGVSFKELRELGVRLNSDGSISGPKTQVEIDEYKRIVQGLLEG